MPLDSTPRSFAALIVRSPTRAPTSASGATSPARALGAPHTICSGSPWPASTRQTCSRSACGCFSAERMRATTTPSRSWPSSATSSTSRPIAVNTAARRSRPASVGTCWRSQFSLNFMLESRDQSSLAGDARSAPPATASGELPEEPQVVVKERAQVVHAVAQHRQPLHAHAEGEAGVALGVDADRAQHVRMDHAAAQHLEPARAAVGALPGDVDLGAGLHEGEVAGAEAHLEIALEERAHELGQRALEVGESGVLVDQQALAL